MEDHLIEAEDKQSTASSPTNAVRYTFGTNSSQLHFPFVHPSKDNVEKKAQDRVILQNNTGEILNVHKVAFSLMDLHHPDSNNSIEITQQNFDTLNDILKCFCILLCMGGYFSGGIWKEDRWLVHKSFHRYMPSTKGKSKPPSSKKDNKSQYNETKHRNEIESVLTQWQTSQHFAQVSTIFVLAPGKNKSFLLGKEGALKSVLGLLEEPTDSIQVKRLVLVDFNSRGSLAMPVSEASFRELERACKSLISYQVQFQQLNSVQSRTANVINYA